MIHLECNSRRTTSCPDPRLNQDDQADLSSSVAEYAVLNLNLGDDGNGDESWQLH